MSFTVILLSVTLKDSLICHSHNVFVLVSFEPVDDVMKYRDISFVIAIPHVLPFHRFTSLIWCICSVYTASMRHSCLYIKAGRLGVWLACRYNFTVGRSQTFVTGSNFVQHGRRYRCRGWCWCKSGVYRFMWTCSMTMPIDCPAVFCSTGALAGYVYTPWLSPISLHFLLLFATVECVHKIPRFWQIYTIQCSATNGEMTKAPSIVNVPLLCTLKQTSPRLMGGGVCT